MKPVAEQGCPFTSAIQLQNDPKGSPFVGFKDIHFFLKTPYFFLKIPLAPIYNNFLRASKELNFAPKAQNCPKEPKNVFLACFF